MNKPKIVLLVLLILLIIVLYNNDKESFQVYDPNKNAKLIMNEHHSGFFCNFNRLIHYLTLYPNIKEIEFNIRAKIHKHKPFIGEDIELFSQLFETYKEEGVDIDELYDIDGNDFKEMPTDKGAYAYYNEHRNKFEPYNKAFKKYILLKPHLKDRLNVMIKHLRSDCDQVVGIFVRSEALAKEQPRERMPTRDMYLEAIKKIDTSYKTTKYFLRVDNDEDLEFYKSKLQPYYVTDIKRSKTNKADAPHRSQETFLPLKDLEDTYLEIALLSNCDYLIHCVSNMASTSLFMNMSQISICVSEPPEPLDS